METTTLNIKTEVFQNLSEEYQKIVVEVHANALGSKDYDTFYRIFKVGNPKIVIETDGNDLWCRIHQDSVKLMTIITKEYGKA